VSQLSISTKRVSPDRSHWQQRLDALTAKHGVAGAVLGILHGNDMIDVASGVTNVRSGDPVHTGTVFQIGSITKVYTATAAMRLVADGLLGLDEPISSWLPELRLVDAGEQRITVRHLLTHTSGIAGDLFTDTGRGDDCLERFADTLTTVPPLLTSGTTFSYCNSGYTLLGRIIERVSGKVWDQAMHDLLHTPIGLDTTMTLPEEALRHSAAMGHERQPDGTLQPAARWGLPRSGGPAGGIVSTARDVLAFARFHLDEGRTHDGTELVPADLVREMRSARIELPFRDGENEALGLPWFRKSWAGHSLIGHDGDTVGQTAFLRILPSQGLAVVLLTNGGPARDLYRDLYREVFAELAGVTMPPALRPPADPAHFDTSRHAGVYQAHDYQNEVFDLDGAPGLRWAATGSVREVMPAAEGSYETVAAGEDLLLYREHGTHRWYPATFLHLPDGRPGLHIGLRVYAKAG
jgi:CubicO group peptidase (beta-lactamase class C family)